MQSHKKGEGAPFHFTPSQKQRRKRTKPNAQPETLASTCFVGKACRKRKKEGKTSPRTYIKKKKKKEEISDTQKNLTEEKLPPEPQQGNDDKTR